MGGEKECLRREEATRAKRSEQKVKNEQATRPL